VSSSFVLDPERIRRAGAAIHSLQNEYPRALPRVVGDVDAWKARAKSRLAALVSRSETDRDRGHPLDRPPDDAPPRAVASRPRTPPAPARLLVHALHWCAWPAAGAARAELEWVAEHREHVDSVLQNEPDLAMVGLIRLARYAGEGKSQRAAASALVEVLARPDLLPPSGNDAIEFLRDLSMGRSTLESAVLARPPIGRETLPHVVRILDDLAAFDVGRRRRVLRLLLELCAVDVPEQRENTFWKQILALRPAMAAAKSARRGQEDSQFAREELEQVEASIGVHFRAAVNFASWAGALEELVKTVLADDGGGLCDALCGLASALPAEEGERWIITTCCAHELSLRDADRAESGKLWLEQLPKLWKIWEGTARDQRAWREHYVLGDARAQADAEYCVSEARSLPALSGALEVLRRSPTCPAERELRILFEIARSVPGSILPELWSRIEKPQEVAYIQEELLRAAAAVIADDVDPWTVVLDARLSRDHPNAMTSLLTLARDHLDRHLLTAFLRTATTEIGSKRCLVLARCLEIARRSPLCIVPARDHPRPPREDVPPSIRAALVDLSRWSERPERAARSILNSDYPEATEVERKLAELRSIGARTPGRRARLRALLARRRSSRLSSPARTARLVAKIHDAACRAFFERAEQAARRAVQERVVAWIGEAPAWAGSDDFALALEGITALEGDRQSLALRVLRRRCGPPPWDLRELGPNRAFVEESASFGVDLRPWLHAAPHFHEELPGVGPVTVTIERDPLELLHMGRWFDTCLSPDCENYYSVFSNIVDVNKQVVYARDARRHVVGRMLIALTDARTLLPFRAYGPTGGDSFLPVAARYLDVLATAMNTRITRTGQVSRLVARAWYDDEAINLTFSPVSGSRGDLIRRRLAAGERADDLVRALSTGDPRPGLLLELLELPEFEDHPARVLELDSLLCIPEVADGIGARIAVLRARAGARDLPAPLLRPLIRALCPHRHPDEYTHSVEFKVLVNTRPLEALRLLRTHCSESDAESLEYDTYEAFVVAYRRLGRHKKADRWLATYVRAFADVARDWSALAEHREDIEMR
jgi:hypothetical protein